MDTDNTQDGAEPSPASAGFQGGTLVQALHILARDIYCEDGIATQCIREAAREIERLRLTPTERCVVSRAADWLSVHARSRNDIHTAGYLCDDAIALRKLLERLG